MMSHEPETLNFSEKIWICSSPILTVILRGIENFLKEWLENSDKPSEKFIRNGIVELWALVTAVVMCSTLLFSLRFVMNFAYEKYLLSENKSMIEVNDFFFKSYLFEEEEKPNTIVSYFYDFYDFMLGTTTNNITVTAQVIQNNFSEINFLQLDLPESWFEKIADFLNTEWHNLLTRFFWKWYFMIAILTMLFCWSAGSGRPLQKLIELAESGISTGAVLATTIYLAIFPIGILMAVPWVVFIIGIPAFLMGCLWGLLMPLIIVFNFILGLLVFLFETAMTSLKRKWESS